MFRVLSRQARPDEQHPPPPSRHARPLHILCVTSEFVDLPTTALAIRYTVELR